MSDSYEDIINLPYEKSLKHPHMSARDRAAQFAPFAALTGFDGVIDETARLTEKYVEADTDRLSEMDEKMRYIEKHLGERPEAVFTCFVPDESKDGGAYMKVKGNVRKIDKTLSEIVFEDGRNVPFDSVTDIEI